jgi:acyl CoA:acetate/3-ketoacid CoA transferase
VYLASPWTDREDLRYLLKNCTATMTESACDMTVTGSVEQGSMGGPQLTDVKFTASR